MPRDDSLADSTPVRSREEAARPRAALVGLGAIAAAVLGYIIYGQVTVAPGAAQMVLVSRGGEVTRVLGPGQYGYLIPWLQGRTVYDMSLQTADRTAPDRGMPALSAEGHPLTVFGTAYWHEGDEAALRWRFANIRVGTDLLSPLMAASVQAVMGRRPMEEIIRDTAAVQAALAEELRTRVHALLHVDITDFAITRIDPGDSYRAVVAEREIGRARAASVAASPALATTNPNAVDVEMIRRWDGRGVIPETLDRRDRRPQDR